MSISQLTAISGAPLVSFSYPNGVWSAFAEAVLARSGIQAAVTVEVGANLPEQLPLRLKRLDTNDVQVPV